MTNAGHWRPHDRPATDWHDRVTFQRLADGDRWQGGPPLSSRALCRLLGPLRVNKNPWSKGDTPGQVAATGHRTKVSPAFCLHLALETLAIPWPKRPRNEPARKWASLRPQHTTHLAVLSGEATLQGQGRGGCGPQEQQQEQAEGQRHSAG